MLWEPKRSEESTTIKMATIFRIVFGVANRTQSHHTYTHTHKGHNCSYCVSDTNGGHTIRCALHLYGCFVCARWRIALLSVYRYVSLLSVIAALPLRCAPYFSSAPSFASLPSYIHTYIYLTLNAQRSRSHSPSLFRSPCWRTTHTHIRTHRQSSSKSSPL